MAVRIRNNSIFIMNAGQGTGYPGFRVDENGHLTVNGGTINDIRLDGSSVAVIDGGTFNGGGGTSMAALGTSNVTVNGGSYAGQISGRATGQATVSVTGGDFVGSSSGFLIGDQAQATLTGGTFQGGTIGLWTADTANVTIHGGTFSGGSDDGLYATDQSVVDIFGGSFNGGATSIIYLDVDARVRIFGYGFNGPQGEVAVSSGTLTGFYFDGTPILMEFARFNNSVIELVSGYEGWAAFHKLEGGDALSAADKNGNGIPNVIELVTGGNPGAGASPSAIAQALVREDAGAGEQDYFKLSYPVTQLSIDFGVESFLEYGTDLTAGSWIKAENGINGVIVTTTPDGFSPGVHRVEVRIPKSLAPDGRLFGRVGAPPLEQP